MAQWWISPYWASEYRRLRDDADRLYRVDIQVTYIRVTNPSDAEAVLDLVFFEQRGDGNFYRSDSAGGSWRIPAEFQFSYRPDPSRRFGDSWYVDGWFEVYTNRDDVVIDASLRRIARNVGSGALAGTLGLVDGVGERTLNLYSRPVTLAGLIRDFGDRFLRDPPSRLFSPGSPPSDELPSLPEEDDPMGPPIGP